ncbi:hypothetical protein NIES267_14520 [Calothrix parasitica NIES-267]|uniref:Uncharacterized protein n=1 Tax=Calothrix parasitica NIES-267 TaxID=1973488 RepID=A0A1Z4LLB0_9CYAN|nr:hypothetical protein NIES267_14520 [Calothrix parasitica NIES-267]
MYKYCDIIIAGVGVVGNNQAEQLHKAYGKLKTNSSKTVNKTICPINLSIEDIKSFGHVRLTDNYRWVPSSIIKVLANHSVDCCMQSDDLPNVENRVEIAKKNKIKVYYRLNNQEATAPLTTSI